MNNLGQKIELNNEEKNVGVFRLIIKPNNGNTNLAPVAGEGKTEYIGKVYRQVEDIDEPVEIVFKVTETTVTSRGQQFLIPEIEVETYWNSMSIEPEEVFDLYHQHGTSEQYHSEFKSEIGLERLPSGYFETNTRVMFLALLAFNILRIMG